MQNQTEKTVLIERLIEVAAHTGIVHHIPGRIRLKLRMSGLLPARNLDADDLVKYFEGILDARVNAASRSIVINYDEKVIAPELWERLVNGKKDPQQRGSVRQQLEKLARRQTTGGF